MDVSVQLLKQRGITVQSYQDLPLERKTVNDPVVIDIILKNQRGEVFRTKGYSTIHDRVLTTEDYLQLVIGRYNESQEQQFFRSWQYKMWGKPIWELSPRLAFVRNATLTCNEYDWYHYDPGWYDHNIRKPWKSLKQRFDAFIA